jgi:arginyl-tRNA synthetase
MTAYIQSDRRSLLLERRKLYEAEVAEALLNEDSEEREERLHLVHACQPMLKDALNALVIYDPNEYKE